MNGQTISILKIAAAASVAMTGAALAHPHESGEGERKIEKVIILDSKEGGKPMHIRVPRAEGGEKVHKVVILQSKDGKPADGKVREFRMLRGDGELTCPNGEATKVDETTGGDRTKVFICADDTLSSAERAKKLEETLGRIRSGEHISDEHKAKVEAALEDAIAKLRASN